MYSPKIRDELIPRIYRVARQAGVHMTTWVNEVIAKALSDNPAAEEEIAPRPDKKLTRKEVRDNGAF